MNFKTLITSLLILFSLNNAFAQSRKYSNDFMNIGVGARAFGMSSSVSASADDVTAAYWNPAGLVGLKNSLQVSAMHSEYFAGIAKYDYGGIAARVDSQSTFAATIIRFGVDGIPNTTELIDAGGNIDYNRITSFSAADYGFIMSYARKAKKLPIDMGINFKIIHRTIGNFASSFGFGIDAGAKYRYRKFTAAIMLRDITTTYNSWTYNLSQSTKDAFNRSGNEIPTVSTEITLPKLIPGINYRTKLNKNLGLLIEANGDITVDGPRNVLFSYSTSPVALDPKIGTELNFKNLIFLRGGIGNIQKSYNFDNERIYTLMPNIGLGIKLNRISIDYALTDIGNASEVLYSNVFSLRLDFDKK